MRTIKSIFLKSLISGIILIPLFLTNIVFSQDEKHDKIIAKVGDEYIYLSDLKRWIGYYDQKKQEILKEKPQYRTIILQRIIEDKILSKDARNEGFDKRPDIKEQIAMLVDDYLAKKYLESLIPQVEFSKEEVEQYYQIHLKDFKKTLPLVKFSLYVLPFSGDIDAYKKKELKKKADLILENIENKNEEKNKQVSESVVGLMPLSKVNAEIRNALLDMLPGEAKVIEGSRGFYIVKLLEKKDDYVPLAEVEPAIRKKLQEEYRAAKIKEILQNLMDKNKVKIYRDVLEQKEILN